MIDIAELVRPPTVPSFGMSAQVVPVIAFKTGNVRSLHKLITSLVASRN